MYKGRVTEPKDRFERLVIDGGVVKKTDQDKKKVRG